MGEDWAIAVLAKRKGTDQEEEETIAIVINKAIVHCGGDCCAAVALSETQHFPPLSPSRRHHKSSSSRINLQKVVSIGFSSVVAAALHRVAAALSQPIA